MITWLLALVVGFTPVQIDRVYTKAYLVYSRDHPGFVMPDKPPILYASRKAIVE